MGITLLKPGIKSDDTGNQGSADVTQLYEPETPEEELEEEPAADGFDPLRARARESARAYFGFVLGIALIIFVSYIHRARDLGIAFEHIVLAATDLGLGTCWMDQSKREELVKSLLDIPDKFRVIALTPLGVSDETPDSKDRKSLDDIVSWEKYSSKAT